MANYAQSYYIQSWTGWVMVYGTRLYVPVDKILCFATGNNKTEVSARRQKKRRQVLADIWYFSRNKNTGKDDLSIL
jgi:hypothetical protein